MSNIPCTKKITETIEKFLADDRRLFVSSSFQTHSIPLLHILSTFGKAIDVVVTDTGYLFPETYSFISEVVSDFDLQIRIVKSDTPKSLQRDNSGNLFYVSDTDFCCELNKVQPLERILPEYDVWINGVRRDQNSVRAGFSEFQMSKHGVLRYHPMLEWTSKEIYSYRMQYGLPEHPLEVDGYLNIGCAPCTSRFLSNEGTRDARWRGSSKQECGLNTDLIIASK